MAKTTLPYLYVVRGALHDGFTLPEGMTIVHKEKDRNFSDPQILTVFLFNTKVATLVEIEDYPYEERVSLNLVHDDADFETLLRVLFDQMETFYKINRERERALSEEAEAKQKAEAQKAAQAAIARFKAS